MDYIPDGDLKKKLDDMDHFDQDLARNCSAQIISALEELRSQDIVHRDLKPDNILVDETDGYLKLIDFGLSSESFENRQLASSSLDKTGTLGYIAPEVLLGGITSFAVDYWALGCMIYEFLFGYPPFNRDTADETEVATIKGHFIFDYDEDMEHYPEAEDLIRKLLNTNPTQRLGYNSIEEIKNHKWFSSINWNDVPTVTFKDDDVDSPVTSSPQFNLHPAQQEEEEEDLDIVGFPSIVIHKDEIPSSGQQSSHGDTHSHRKEMQMKELEEEKAQESTVSQRKLQKTLYSTSTPDALSVLPNPFVLPPDSPLYQLIRSGENEKQAIEDCRENYYKFLGIKPDKNFDIYSDQYKDILDDIKSAKHHSMTRSSSLHHMSLSSSDSEEEDFHDFNRVNYQSHMELNERHAGHDLRPSSSFTEVKKPPIIPLPNVPELRLSDPHLHIPKAQSPTFESTILAPLTPPDSMVVPSSAPKY